ncbi:Ion transport protein [Galbibacter marinus]|uniref:Ion transport protein n=1 Tax=Galbibacter marinus TaxID=555500 RepID=K2P4U8_9FLAO|nr:ion transporter [Galbibacter marinus]EKF56063.1 Ion transport protein [Galbibacter marinus]
MKENKDVVRNWKAKLHEIIYEADTPTGKWFDISLIFLILVSIFLVILESVESFDQQYHDFLIIAEWIITILFSIEYIARFLSINKPFRYVFSFYGIVDLLSTIPLYLSFIFPGSQVLIVIRAIRLLRLFRILKMVKFIGEARKLKEALWDSRTKIAVFIFTMVILSVIIGTVMYLVEGKDAGFTSIPKGIYWTIITMTTVGYGDIVPLTSLGQTIAVIVMVMGYGIIAVPTGIVSAEFSKQNKLNKIHTNTQACPNCNAHNHNDHAKYCYNCGNLLNEA